MLHSAFDHNSNMFFYAFSNFSQNLSKYYTAPHQSCCISHAFLNPIIATYLLVNIFISVRVAKWRVFPVWHNIFSAYKFAKTRQPWGEHTPGQLFRTVLKHGCTSSQNPSLAGTHIVLAPTALLYVSVKCSFHVSAAQWRTIQRTWMSLYQLCGCWPAVGCWHDLWPMVSLAIGHVHVAFLCFVLLQQQQ